jgi:glycopeptide antibiotics resistance protein
MELTEQSKPMGTRKRTPLAEKKSVIARCARFNPTILFSVGFMLAIFFSSFLHTDGSTKGFEFIGLINPTLQSVFHIPMFAGFTILLLVLLGRSEKSRRIQILSAFILANYVGILNECLQSLIPGRSASFVDITLNVTGSIVGMIVYFRFEGLRLRRR